MSSRADIAEPPPALAALVSGRHASTAAAIEAALEVLAGLAGEEAFAALVPAGRRQPEIRLTPGLDFPDPTAVRQLARRRSGPIRGTRIGDRRLTVHALDAGGDTILLGATGTAGRRAVDRWGPVLAHVVARASLTARERRRAEEMQRLSATTSRVAASLDLDEVLTQIVGDAVELLGADSGDMLLLDPDRSMLRIAAVANFEPEMVGFEMTLGEGVSSRAMAARRAIIVDDYERYRYRVRRLERYRFRSVLCAPLLVRDEPIGALNVHATDPTRRFDEEDAALLAGFAAHAAIALDNARRFGNETRLASDLARANDELERSLTLQSRLVEQVLQDRGPEGVATELARLLSMPVVLHDPLLRVLAGAAPGGGPWDDLVLVRNGRSGSELDGFLDRIVASGRPAIWARDGQTRIVAPVRVAVENAGFLVLPAREPLSPLDRALVDVAVAGVALALAKLRAQVEIEQRLRGDVVGDLVGGAFASPASISARAATLGLDLREPHDLLVIDLDPERTEPSDATIPPGPGGEAGETASRRRLFGLVHEQLEASAPSSVAAVVAGSTVALVSQAERARGGLGDRDPAELATELLALLERQLAASVTIGIGERCREPTEYRASFELATGAIAAMRKLGRLGEIADGRRLGVSRLLIAATDPSELRAFAQRSLGPLLREDRADLLDTLRAYVDAGFNQREAARRSFLHFNTVAYRLRRLEELLGVDLDDPQVRLDLTLALRVAALTGTGTA